MSDVRTVSIDFLQCTPVKERVYITYGSFAYELLGKNSQGFCVLRYGGEVENPNWGEKLATKCLVPDSIGNMSFEVKDLGPDFEVISEYCAKQSVSRNSQLSFIEIGGMVMALVLVSLCAYLVVSRIKGPIKPVN